MKGIMGAIAAALAVSTASAQGFEYEKETWECKDLEWVEKAQVTNGTFMGAARAICRFEAKGGQGFSGLRGFLTEKTEKSNEVHLGPKAEIYQKLESNLYEVTQEMTFGDSIIAVRAFTHIATNLRDKLIYDAFSKSIRAEGPAALLKKFDVQTTVTSTNERKVYSLTITIRPQVKKPALVPSGIFRDELKKQIEKMAPDVERGIIEEIEFQI